MSIILANSDQPREPHRGAAAHKNAALSFGKCIERGTIGDAHMAGAGEFQPPADDGALQRREHRHAAALDPLECSVPGARVPDTFGGVRFRHRVQIEAGAEVFALAMDNDCADIARQVGKEPLDAGDSHVIYRIALVGPTETQHRDGAAQLDLQAFRQAGSPTGSFDPIRWTFLWSKLTRFTGPVKRVCPTYGLRGIITVCVAVITVAPF